MSSSPSSPALPVAPGHVRLTLIRDANSYFFLEIPRDRIVALCLKPLRYLLFLGWCILGTEGVLHHNGAEIGTNGNLDVGGIYHYTASDVLGGFLLYTLLPFLYMKS
jgi:hypothetical protein